MDTNLDHYVISSKATLVEAIAKIDNNHSRAVIVLMEDKVIGMISEGDIMRALLASVDVHAPLLSFVRHDFKYLSEVDYERALELVKKFGITLIPVVDSDYHLLDVVHINDILAKVNLV